MGALRLEAVVRVEWRGVVNPNAVEVHSMGDGRLTLEGWRHKATRESANASIKPSEQANPGRGGGRYVNGSRDTVDARG